MSVGSGDPGGIGDVGSLSLMLPLKLSILKNINLVITTKTIKNTY